MLSCFVLPANDAASILSVMSNTICRDPGSSRGPSDLRSDALPTELSRLGHTVPSLVPLYLLSTAREECNMHQPGIEPGSHQWQRCILPLDH